MPQFAYAFDPHAANDDNIVRDEAHVLNATMSPYRVIIPNFAPFFEDLEIEVKCNNKPLLMGVDYYLSHKYFTGIERTGKLMYSGIWIVNPKLSGTVTVKYRTLGGKFPVQRSIIDDYLTNRQTDPQHATWEEVINDDPVFPPVDLQFDRDSFVDEENVQTAIREIADVVRNKDQTTNDMYMLLDDWFLQLKKVVDESPLKTHQDNFNNPHGEVWFESQALHEAGIAKDTAKVAGMTINQLADYVNSRGISQADLDNYVKRSGGNTVVGDIVLKDGLMFIEFLHVNSAYLRINMSNGNIGFDAISDALVHADKDKNSPGAKATLRSGDVELTVTSRGTAQTDDDARINDKTIIHDGNLEAHVPDAGTHIIDIQTKDSDSLNFSGKGVAGNPLKADAALEDATTSEPGIAVGTADETKDQPTKVALSQGTAKVDAKIKAKVPDTVKINGVRLDRDIILTKDKFGLGNVDNLSDMDMPVNQNHENLLAGKAVGDHTHSFAEIGFARATDAVFGVTFLSDDPTSSATDRGFSAAKLSDLNSEVMDLEFVTSTRLPDDVIDITQYGGNHWLPIPVQGSYEGSGHFKNARQMAGFVEEDGKCIFYRNGLDLVTQGIFYAYATFLSDGSITDYIATATRYRPATLPDGWEVLYCLRGSRDGMYVRLQDESGGSHAGVVIYNNSGNGANHKVALLPDGINAADPIPIIYGDYVYYIGTWVGYGNGIRHSFYRAPISDFDTFGVANFEEVVVSGTDFFNEQQSGSQIVLCRNDWSDDENAEAICIRKDTRYSINPRWNNIGLATYIKGDLLRIFVKVGSYESSSFDSSRYNWSYSVTVNLATRQLVIDSGRNLPYIFNGRNNYGGNMGANNSQSMGWMNSGNIGAGEITDGKFTVVWHTLNESTPSAGGQTHNNADYFDSLHAANRSIQTVGSRPSLTGNFGSVVGVMQRHVAMLPNRYLHSYSGWNMCKFVPNYTFANGMKGYGPHVDRSRDGDWRKYRHNVYFTNGSDVELAFGGILHKANLSAWTQMDANHNTSGSISTTVEHLDALSATLEPIFEADAGADTLQGVDVVVYILPDERIPPMWTAVGRFVKASDGAVRSINKVGTLESVPRSGSVGNFRVRGTLGTASGASRYSSYSSPRDYLPNSGIIDDEASGKMLFVLNTNCSFVYGANTKSFLVEIDYSSGTPDPAHMHNADIFSYRASGMLITKDYGLVIPVQHNSFTAITARHIGKTAADWKVFYANKDSYKETVVLHTSQVAEGWVVYFTQDVQFFINSTRFMIPETGLDLSALFPSTYKSNTFYIYASVEGGVAHYVIKEQYVADSSTEIYIGFCRTTDEKIVDLQVNRATRMGDFREFTEHLTDPKPHGLDLSQVTTDDIGLGLIENKDIRHSLVVPTFKDVFNNWYRLSHQGEKPYPAIPAETTTWTYAEANDEIRNTTNSSSFVGMVSPEGVEVGDYDFITGLSSTNGDDDWVGVIFALVEKDGIQHTLSALCSGTDTRNVHFAVYYNWAQGASRGQKTLYSHTTTLKHGWDEIPERILTVKRRGDVFNLHVTKMMTDAATERTFSFDVKDHPELATLFRGAVRFGYCAQSQPYSTWRNILRPDEDGKNFYASQKLYRDNFSWSSRLKTISGVVAPTVNGGDTDTYDVPIPAEYRDMNYHAWCNIDQSSDSSGGITTMALSHARVGDVIRFTALSHNRGGFYTALLRYNITFFNDVRMI